MNRCILPANCKVLFFWGFFFAVGSAVQQLMAGTGAPGLFHPLWSLTQCSGCSAMLHSQHEKKYIHKEKWTQFTAGCRLCYGEGADPLSLSSTSCFISVTFSSSCWLPGYGVFGRAVKERHTALRIFFSNNWRFLQNSKSAKIFFQNWIEISTSPTSYCDLHWLDMCDHAGRVSPPWFLQQYRVWFLMRALFFVCDLYLYIKHLIKTT